MNHFGWSSQIKITIKNKENRKIFPFYLKFFSFDIVVVVDFLINKMFGCQVRLFVFELLYRKSSNFFVVQ